MSRPTNKVDLIAFSQQTYQELMDFIYSLSEKARYQTFKTRDRDKNIRDLIYHLHAWHMKLIEWFQIEREGGTPILPSPGYTWDDMEEINEMFYEDCQTYTLDHTLNLIEKSHQDLLKLIDTYDEEVLCTAGHFKWAGKAPVSNLIDAIMAHHYEWGLSTLKKLYKHKE